MKDEFQDELISAYLDDELSSEDRSRVEQRLAGDEELRRMVDELRSLREEIQSLPHHKLEADFAQRVLQSAEREMLARRPDEKKGPSVDGPFVKQRDYNKRRRLSIRGVLWSGVAIACAVIFGVELLDSDFNLALMDKEARPSGDVEEDSSRASEKNNVKDNTDYDTALGFRQSKNGLGVGPESMSKQRLGDSANQPQDPSSGRSIADIPLRKAQSHRREKSYKEERREEGAFQNGGSVGLGGEKIEDSREDGKSAGRKREFDKKDSLDDFAGQKGTLQFQEIWSQGEATPVYLVMIDLPLDVASRKALFSTFREHQLSGDNQRQESLALGEAGQLASAQQVFSVTLPQAKADALIASLEKRRGDFDMSVHSPLFNDATQQPTPRSRTEEKDRFEDSRSSPRDTPAASPERPLQDALPTVPRVAKNNELADDAVRGVGEDKTTRKNAKIDKAISKVADVDKSTVERRKTKPSKLAIERFYKKKDERTAGNTEEADNDTKQKLDAGRAEFNLKPKPQRQSRLKQQVKVVFVLRDVRRDVATKADKTIAPAEADEIPAAPNND